MKTRVNLMPKDRKQELPVNPDKVLAAAAIIVTLTASALFFVNKRQLKQLRQQEIALNSALQAEQRALAVMELSDQQKQTSEQSGKLITQIIGARTEWSDIFKELSITIPVDSWLTEFAAKSQSGKVSYTIVGRAAAQEVMAKFYERLEQSYNFKDLKLFSSTKLENYHPNLFEFKFGNVKQREPATVSQKGK